MRRILLDGVCATRMLGTARHGSAAVWGGAATARRVITADTDPTRMCDGRADRALKWLRRCGASRRARSQRSMSGWAMRDGCATAPAAAEVLGLDTRRRRCSHAERFVRRRGSVRRHGGPMQRLLRLEDSALCTTESAVVALRGGRQRAASLAFLESPHGCPVSLPPVTRVWCRHGGSPTGRLDRDHLASRPI